MTRASSMWKVETVSDRIDIVDIAEWQFYIVEWKFDIVDLESFTVYIVTWKFYIVDLWKFDSLKVASFTLLTELEN